jgi:hypothetical protein
MLGKALLSASVSASASAPAVYVEDVFSTFLYTGNGSTQTITNGIDLAGEGGLVWTKNRSAVQGNFLVDTLRGGDVNIKSNTTGANDFGSGQGAQAFTSTGFTAGGFSADNYASWTFRKAPKFFDVVTYTGNGGTQQNIPHNLGSSPNCIIVKRTDAAGDWYVAPMVLSNWNNDYLVLNSTAAKVSSSDIWQGTSGKSSTTFGVRDGSTVNISGATYVAYLFAHNAGGFGDAGTDNVISCGSFTTDGSGTATVNLGWEPQWILAKRSDNVQDWKIIDTMRGFAIPSSSDATLYPNASSAEGAGSDWGAPTATGFTADSQPSSANFIYIAIRRGPMRAPTSGTEVFAASTAAAGTLFATGITSLDAAFIVNRTVNGSARSFFSRLAASRGLDPTSTAAEGNYGTAISWDLNNAFYQSAIGSAVQWLFRRAPGFFDVVCTEGSGATPQTHNLGAAPEMMIVKFRNGADWWYVYHKDMGTNYGIQLQATDAKSTSAGIWNNTAPTSTQFVANIGSATTYVAYLFATLAGVSKVGSYTGTGTTLSIDCGFTAGARLVLIKRTDSTGDWYVWDTARGISSGNDPYLLLNSTAAEVTGTDYIDPLSSGFQISSTAPAAINASGGSFIFLAIA